MPTNRLGVTSPPRQQASFGPKLPSFAMAKEQIRMSDHGVIFLNVVSEWLRLDEYTSSLN